MKIRTHIMGKDGICQRCGELIPVPVKDGKTTQVIHGDRIGVIDGLRSSEPSSYLITQDHDSNLPCERNLTPEQSV